MKDLHFSVYKTQLKDKLKPTDHSQRKEFVEWVIEQQKVDAGFSNEIIFNDEINSS